jgi:hypothetical protein
MIDPESLGRPAADLERILATLADHEVDFLVIGGVAAVAHGVPRLTLDVDIIPAPDASNLRRLAAALTELRARAYDDRRRELPLDLSHPEELALGNYFLLTDAGGLDLVNGPRPDLKRFKRLASRAIMVRIAGSQVKIIGRDDLIAMKREAGRDKDLRDIAALTEAERLANAEQGRGGGGAGTTG